MNDNKNLLHKQLFDAKKTFDKTIEILTNEDWKKKCGEKPFSIGEVMMQITSSLEFLPHVIKDIRRGKGFTPPPKIITKLIGFFFMGFLGRDLTREEIKVRYDAAHKKAISLLGTIDENDWQKKAKFFGKYETIEQVFLSYLQSFNEDMERVKTAIKKPALKKNAGVLIF